MMNLSKATCDASAKAAKCIRLIHEGAKYVWNSPTGSDPLQSWVHVALQEPIWISRVMVTKQFFGKMMI